MTLRDFMRISSYSDLDKVIIFSDGKGWTNIKVQIDDYAVTILPDTNEIFTSDKE